MRKSLSVAVGAVMLACAGISQASIQPSFLTPISDSLAAEYRQISKMMDGNPSNGRKTDVAYSISADRQARQVVAPPEEESNHAMLIAGLMIMGVIIKRRHGNRD